MDIDFSEIIYLKDPEALTLKADYQQFLLSLMAPTVIDVSGKDNKRCRVFITLLHGNEPSGLMAIHRWLTANPQRSKPATNIRFIFCSIEAASLSPFFSKRYLDGHKDINRCFGTIHDHSDYQRANLLEKAIKEVSPEAIIDLHNTSGSSPAYASGSIITASVLSLASSFCRTMLLSDFKVNSLMEQKFDCPFVTIECGDSRDQQSHEIAYQGIKHICSCENISNFHQEKQLEIIYEPLRLQLKKDVLLSYSDHDEGSLGVTLKNNIEQYNFGGAAQGQMLGWLDSHLLDNLQLLNSQHENVVDSYFSVRGNQLVCAMNLRIFMATASENIAKMDYLFYVVKSTS
ncbi:MAG: hypothetical protein ACI9LM_001672 [Alteromonadaceae bacterium]|jgi:hypothetical protein